MNQERPRKSGVCHALVRQEEMRDIEEMVKQFWKELFEELAANDERKIVWLKDNRGRSAILIHRKPTILRKEIEEA